MSTLPTLRIAHLSDLHVGHVTANLMRLGRLILPRSHGEGAWSIATRLVASSWFERRSLVEPLVRAAHLAHHYETRSLVAVVQSVRDQGCDHVILTGDIANLGAESEMREAKLVLSSFGYEGKNLTVVPGNHDVVNFNGVAEFQNVMEQPSWPHLKRISEDIAVIALDSTVYGKDLDWRDALGMNARGEFSPSCIEQAEELLRSLPEKVFKVLCCHHHLVDLPPDGYVDDWAEKFDPRQSGPAQRAEKVVDLAEKYKVGLLLFGHRHRATHHLFTIRGIPASCSGSVTELDSEGRLRFRIFDFEGTRIRRRRWIHVDPRDADRELVVQTLRGVSATQREEKWKLTEKLPTDGSGLDFKRLAKKTRALDRRAIDEIRKKLEKERQDPNTRR